MQTNTKSYRYQLAKKAKSDCPDCGPGHRKTLSQYIDTKTNELLPEEYGRCDRESNCGYHLSPYHKGPSGLSYADEQKQPPLPKEWFRMAWKQKRNYSQRSGIITTLMQMGGATQEQAERVTDYVFKPSLSTLPTQPPLVYSIPDEVFTQSIVDYDKSQFALLLARHFGVGVACSLLQRFQIGSSPRWPGACVFWYIDEQGRKRGGQIKLFGDDWHTVKYIDREGQKRSKTDWVHTALKYRLEKTGAPLPDWLTKYIEQAERSPCLFGLPQLLTEPVDKPVAIVEAPKTAVICSYYCPDFVWLAVGALSYLNARRLASVRHRKIMLYPDLSKDGSAYASWSQRANELSQQGFQILVSDYLEQNANDEQRVRGYDLADYLLEEWNGYPSNWDAPNPPNAQPAIKGIKLIEVLPKSVPLKD